MAHPFRSGAIRTLLRRAVFATSERLLGRQRLAGPVPCHPGARFSLQASGAVGPLHVVGGDMLVAGWCIDFGSGEPLRWRARLGGTIEEASPLPRPDIAAAFSQIAPVPVACGGLVRLPVRIGPSLVTIEAEASPGAWTRLYRATVIGLGRHRSVAAPGLVWQADGWRADDPTRTSAAPAGEQGADPRVTAIVVGDDDEALAATLNALGAQTVFAWDAIRVRPGAAPTFAQALAEAKGEYILPLRAGDRLRTTALAALLAAFEIHPAPDLVYADEIGPHCGSALPFFKPSWSPDRLEGLNYIGAPALYRASLARATAATSPYDLALRFTERTGAVAHVPEILCERSASALTPTDPTGDEAALAARLRRSGRTGAVARPHAEFAALTSLVTPPDPPPLVSIVIPTAGRDLQLGDRRIDLVVDCVRGIRERSTYAALEFVVVANTDLPGRKADALRQLGCRIHVYDEPTFNVARKLNLGAADAWGEYLLLLNDDVEVVAPDWIERMLAQAAKPHIGVVGAELLYPDGTLQHGGVALIDGNPIHVGRFNPGGDLGYVFSLAAPTNVSAVTGACMMVRSALYDRVGGYTEAFAINFNDVDFCLKVRQLGLHVVLEPAATLIHYESVSRVPVVDPAEYALFQSRWRGRYPVDPFYRADAFEIGMPR